MDSFGWIRSDGWIVSEYPLGKGKGNGNGNAGEEIKKVVC